MTLVKANMSFYHDKVGTRASNEVFEIRNAEVCAQLEKAGYITKVEGQEAQEHQEKQQSQQEVGQRNKLTNEAVSMANHVHNVQANEHSQKVVQMRQQQTRQQAQQEEKAQSKKAEK